MSKQITPCEELGYKAGDEFEVIRHHAFKKGQVVTLHEDDGTECPLFSGDGGGAGVFDGVECSFATLNEQVRKIANKLKPAKQALADAINQNGGWVEGGDWHKNGELPPVGDVCIFDPGDGAENYNNEELEAVGCDVEIIAHTKFNRAVGCVAVFKWDRDSGCGVSTGCASVFRPIRTEREKAIDEMVSLVEPLATYREFASAIYDAGMYKEVK